MALYHSKITPEIQVAIFRFMFFRLYSLWLVTIPAVCPTFDLRMDTTPTTFLTFFNIYSRLEMILTIFQYRSEHGDFYLL